VSSSAGASAVWIQKKPRQSVRKENPQPFSPRRRCAQTALPYFFTLVLEVNAEALLQLLEKNPSIGYFELDEVGKKGDFRRTG